MTLTQTALDREMLLVPVAGPRPGPETGEDADPDRPVAAAVADAQSTAAGLPVTVRVLRSALIVLAVLAVGLVAQIVVISRLEYRSAQVSLLNTFRSEVALGTAPKGPLGGKGHLLALGTPMALITIPALDVRAVVLEGTTASVLTKGPGHVRTTVFPGGTGSSVILGHATTYGGPFGGIADLRKGQVITVVTQVGTSHFRVLDVRRAGARVRPPAAGTSRLTLGTASGPALAPSGVVWVDATKVGPPLAADAVPNITLLAAEEPLAVDTGTLWAVLLWLEALAILVVGAVWSWRRWGRAQTWIVFTTPMLLVWVFLTDQIVRLLPNLL